MQPVLNVHIAEIKIAKHGEILKAVLGSCVGIGFIWKEKKICGLAHCLLPESPSPTYSIGARFVDQAIRSLLSLMKIKEENYPEIEVVIAGGGNMTNPDVKEKSRLVGSHNYENAIHGIRELGLRIVYEEPGEELGKKIILDGKLFTYKVESIPRLIKAS